MSSTITARCVIGLMPGADRPALACRCSAIRPPPGRVPTASPPSVLSWQPTYNTMATPATAFRLQNHLAILTSPSKGKGCGRLLRAEHREEAMAGDALAWRPHLCQCCPMSLLLSRSWTHWSMSSLPSRVPARTVR